MRLADVAAHWRQQAELTSSAVERNAFRHCADELEAAAPVTDAGLDVERLALTLQAIHGVPLPLPNHPTPRAYATIIARWYNDPQITAAAARAALSRQAEKETA